METLKGQECHASPFTLPASSPPPFWDYFAPLPQLENGESNFKGLYNYKRCVQMLRGALISLIFKYCIIVVFSLLCVFPYTKSAPNSDSGVWKLKAHESTVPLSSPFPCFLPFSGTILPPTPPRLENGTSNFKGLYNFPKDVRKCLKVC